MHMIRFSALVGFVLVISGCTEMQVDAEAKIFQSSTAGFVLRIILGIGLIGAGGVLILLGVLPAHRPKHQFGARNQGISTGQRFVRAITGSGIGFTGSCLILISLIFASRLHVTVYPDRVAMASTYNQTGGKEVVPFSNLKSVELRDEPNIVGKLRTHIVFTLKDGGSIKQIAGVRRTLSSRLR